MRLGCGRDPPVQQAEAVLLQYSTDGGITWRTIESFSFGPGTSWPFYIALNLPDEARTNSTRVRWKQPTQNGTHLEDWAIDQVSFYYNSYNALIKGGGVTHGELVKELIII